MICILGKTASGKNAIIEKLQKEYGYKRIVTYTTRPMRDGETQDVDYHFIGKTDFIQMIERDELAEWKVYESAFGQWYYGVAKKDIDNDPDKILIITPAGYRDITDSLGHKPKSLYIYANNATIKNRLRLRGDNEDESKRRIEQDNKDFKDMIFLADKIVYNNEEDDLDDVVHKVIEVLDEMR